MPNLVVGVLFQLLTKFLSLMKSCIFLLLTNEMKAVEIIGFQYTVEPRLTVPIGGRENSTVNRGAR